MSAVVRPLHLAGQHVVRAIEARVAKALQGWTAAWSRVPLSEHAVQVEPVEAALTSIGPCSEFSASGGRVWVRSNAEDKEALAEAVLGSAFLPLAANADAWAQSALADAMHERNLSLAQALVGVPDAITERQPDVATFAFGSGALQIRCEMLGLFAIADAGALVHVPPPDRAGQPKPLSLRALLDAVRDEPVSLTVSLGSVELNLPHLLALEAGDVICLPTRVSDLLPVTLEGRAVARASLGQTGRHKAVQLVSLESSSVNGVSR